MTFSFYVDLMVNVDLCLIVTLSFISRMEYIAVYLFNDNSVSFFI